VPLCLGATLGPLPHPRAYPLTGVKKDDLDKALGYFENNAPRMRYKWFRSRGLFVGSGTVEAGCKAVIGQRLKQSGMRWTVAGADAIAALRCREAGPCGHQFTGRTICTAVSADHEIESSSSG
jgi:hypothetical protein